MDRRAVPALLLVAVAAACTGNPEPGTRTPTVAPAPSSTGITGPVVPGEPLTWFAPLPPLPTSSGRPYTGSDDFMALFEADAAWTRAAGHVHVFKLYGEWVAHSATDDQLSKVVADLKARHIALAVEAGPLEHTGGCGAGVEGFAGTAEGLTIAGRIKAAGGTLDYVALDEPFAYGHLYDGPNACRWSTEKIAGQVADFVRAMRGIYPNVVVGDIEPLWPGADASQFEHWLRTYAAVADSDFPFFHLDVDFSRPDWPEQAKALENFCRSRGTPFGIIYIGQGDTDEAFSTSAQDRFVTYESKAGGHPDQVVFQSWLDKPDRVLPETSPGAFTWLIDRYFRTRTTLDLEVGPSQFVGSQRASGFLTDASGAPVAGAPIRVTLTPVDGPGSLGTYSLSGTVPPGAASALVGLRVNTECDCAGPGDLSLYQAMYSAGGGSTSLVPDGDFADGLDGWGLYGDEVADLRPSDGGAGSMLQIEASKKQSVIVNSPEFSVRAGEPFTVTFDARVAPASAGSGYFTLVFLGPPGEISRERIPFAPVTFDLGTRTTDEQGSFRTTFHAPGVYLHLGRMAVEVSFAGDDRYWPAFGSVTISV